MQTAFPSSCLFNNLEGGMSLVVGGALMRSAQFGVYDAVLLQLRKRHSSLDEQPVEKILGILDPHVILAGIAGERSSFDDCLNQLNLRLLMMTALLVSKMSVKAAFVDNLATIGKYFLGATEGKYFPIVSD